MHRSVGGKLFVVGRCRTSFHFADFGRRSHALKVVRAGKEAREGGRAFVFLGVCCALRRLRRISGLSRDPREPCSHGTKQNKARRENKALFTPGKENNSAPGGRGCVSQSAAHAGVGLGLMSGQTLAIPAPSGERRCRQTCIGLPAVFLTPGPCVCARVHTTAR